MTRRNVNDRQERNKHAVYCFQVFGTSAIYCFVGGKIMAMDAEKSKKGGARAGAGRKTSGQRGKTAHLNFRLAPEELDIIKQLATEAQKTVSRYLVDLALSKK